MFIIIDMHSHILYNCMNDEESIAQAINGACTIVLIYLWPDFRKPTKLSHSGFQEILIKNIPTTIASLCLTVAM